MQSFLFPLQYSSTLLRQLERGLTPHHLSLQVTGAESIESATVIHGIARTLEAQGDLDKSEALYRRALAIRRRVLGDTHHSTKKSAMGLLKLRAVLDARAGGRALQAQRSSASLALEQPPPLQ